MNLLALAKKEQTRKCMTFSMQCHTKDGLCYQLEIISWSKDCSRLMRRFTLTIQIVPVFMSEQSIFRSVNKDIPFEDIFIVNDFE